MGRLIDADKLLEETRRDRDYARKNGFLDMYYERQVLIDRIKAQPTAYDIDKVVAELNELDATAIKRYEGGTFGNYEGTDYYIEKSKAIEIVKQVGVSDDVCEWKSTQINNEWKPSCEPNSTYNVFGIAWFKRCPYCGKKIKVVE